MDRRIWQGSLRGQRMVENKKALARESHTTDFIISQNAKKESFILYTEQKEVFENLSDEDAGKLIKGIFEHATGNQPEFNNLLKLVFIPIRQQLDRNAQKYLETKEKRRVAGAKGGKQKVANQANANFAKQNQAKKADNDNVNVNVNVNAINNIILSLNTQSGFNYKMVQSNINLIKARLKDYSEEELLQMVQYKCNEWRNNEEFKKYLRPATLFNSTKCEMYVAQSKQHNAKPNLTTNTRALLKAEGDEW